MSTPGHDADAREVSIIAQGNEAGLFVGLERHDGSGDRAESSDEVLCTVARECPCPLRARPSYALTLHAA